MSRSAIARLLLGGVWLAAVGGCGASGRGGGTVDAGSQEAASDAAPSCPALVRALAERQPFVPVYRDDPRLADLSAVQARFAIPPGMMESGRSFYVAIQKDQLAGRWFLSAFLQQYYQAAGEQYFQGDKTLGGLFKSLGTRVVSLVLDAGKLYVYDVDDRKKSNDVVDPQVIVEAFPVVSGFDSFNRIPGADGYVLIDPAAGVTRFGVEASSARFVADGSLSVDLAVAQRFRKVDDGFTFQKLFSASYSRSTPGKPDSTPRASGTLG